MKWGTYGKLRSKEHPYRTDIGIPNKTDFITVGKVDSKLYSFKGWSYFRIFKYWTAFTEAGKKIYLRTIFQRENGDAAQRIKSCIEPPIVEIGNEPNLFPYMSPSLYAWYYGLWWDFIKFVRPDAKVMNGGYWINSGLPNGIMKCLPLLGIEETNAEEYHRDFLFVLPREKHPDILNLHFYPFGKSYMSGADGMAQLYYFDNKHANIIVSEYGNINPFSLSTTCRLVDEMILDIDSLDNLSAAYYFKETGTDSKFDEFMKEYRKWKKPLRWLKKLLRFINRWPNWMLRRLPKLFGVLSAKDAQELILLAEKYEKQLPIQGLETNGKLNELGETYFDCINQ